MSLCQCHNGAGTATSRAGAACYFAERTGRSDIRQGKQTVFLKDGDAGQYGTQNPSGNIKEFIRAIHEKAHFRFFIYCKRLTEKKQPKLLDTEDSLCYSV